MRYAHAQLATFPREWARSWPHAGTRLKAGRPALFTMVPWLIPKMLKYLAMTVITAASTVLAKSVRFPEHIKSRGLCWYPGSHKSVHIKLLGYSVRFSHSNVRLLGLSSLHKVCLPCDLPFLRLSLYRRTNRQMDRQTDRQTDRIVNYSNSRCACTRG